MFNFIVKLIGIVLILIGVLIVVFCERIVFPGLERIVGIETIVGRESVVYENPDDPDSDYVFTNPRAMVIWKLSVALVGLVFIVCGMLCVLKNKLLSIYRCFLRICQESAIQG